MSLIPCRACEHQVDTSALACPQCGATDPGSKISRQQRQLRNFLLQLVLGVGIAAYAGWYVWQHYLPLIKQAIVRQNPG